MPPMNRGAFPYQTDQSIGKMVMSAYMDEPTFYDKIAKIADFPAGRYYAEAEISGLGPLNALGEGEAITFDTPVEGHKKTISTVKYGQGFQHTEEMKADELFNMVAKIAPSMAKSAAYTREQSFFNLFNNGFSTELAWDGGAVFSSRTTMKSGDTISNLGSADLSDTSLKAAFDYFLALKDEAGMPCFIDPDLLIVPNELRYLANDLLKATGRVWDSPAITAANSEKHYMNSLNPTFNVVPKWDYMATRYITDADSWFLVSKEYSDARFYWKKKPTVSSSNDFATDNTLYKLIMRFALGVFDYKGMYGSPGAG
jgi:hypothetical protein